MQTIQNAVQFLMEQQSDHGGFLSTTYGALGQGAATTSLVLYAMKHVPPKFRESLQGRLQKAFDFLRPGIEKRGCVAAPDGTLDYPTYASALTRMSIDSLRLHATEKEKQTLFDYVLGLQLTEELEVPANSIHHGGWDNEAESGATGEVLQGTNISLTTFCLEMLSGFEIDSAAAAIKRGRKWIEQCQNPDGGFIFHALRSHSGNKANSASDTEKGTAVSYGSATCDGLRALFYTGAEETDERVKSAIRWIEQHPEVKFVPGFRQQDSGGDWQEGLRFYYRFSLSKSLKHLSAELAKKLATAITGILESEQLTSGGWKNEQPRMFEDDELLATSFALIAYCKCCNLIEQ